MRTTLNKMKKTIRTACKRFRRMRAYARKLGASWGSKISKKQQTSKSRPPKPPAPPPFDRDRLYSSSLSCSVMLPVENQESCKSLSRHFYSPRKRSFCRAVRNEHDVSGPQHGIRGLPGQDHAEVYGRLRSCSVPFIGADNACAALGGRARQAFTQGDHLQHRDLLIRFHCETARPLHRSHRIHDSRSRNFDDVSRIYRWIVAGIGRIEEILQIYLDHLLRNCARLVGISVRCAGPAKLLQPHHWRRFRQPARFRKKELGRVFLTRTPQNDDVLPGIVG